MRRQGWAMTNGCWFAAAQNWLMAGKVLEADSCSRLRNRNGVNQFVAGRFQSSETDVTHSRRGVDL